MSEIQESSQEDNEYSYYTDSQGEGENGDGDSSYEDSDSEQDENQQKEQLKKQNSQQKQIEIQQSTGNDQQKQKANINIQQSNSIQQEQEKSLQNSQNSVIQKQNMQNQQNIDSTNQNVQQNKLQVDDKPIQNQNEQKYKEQTDNLINIEQPQQQVNNQDQNMEQSKNQGKQQQNEQQNIKTQSKVNNTQHQEQEQNTQNNSSPKMVKQEEKRKSPQKQDNQQGNNKQKYNNNEKQQQNEDKDKIIIEENSNNNTVKKQQQQQQNQNDQDEQDQQYIQYQKLKEQQKALEQENNKNSQQQQELSKKQQPITEDKQQDKQKKQEKQLKEKQQQIIQEQNQQQQDLQNKRVIQIEICKNCHLHQYNTRHDEQKYKNIFMQFKHALEQNLPSTIVIQQAGDQNNPNHVSNVLPHLGAFEIRIQNITIFSKIKDKQFPHVKKILPILQEVYQCLDKGESIMKYDVSQNVKYPPIIKHRAYYVNPLKRRENKLDYDQQFNIGNSKLSSRQSDRSRLFSPQQLDQLANKMQNNYNMRQIRKNSNNNLYGPTPVQYQHKLTSSQISGTNSQYTSPKNQNSLQFSFSNQSSPYARSQLNPYAPHKSNLQILRDQVSNPALKGMFKSQTRHTRALTSDKDLQNRKNVKGANFSDKEYNYYFTQVNPKGYAQFQAQKIRKMEQKLQKINNRIYNQQCLKPHEKDMLNMSRTSEFQQSQNS